MSQKNTIQLPVEEYETLQHMLKAMSHMQAKLECLESSTASSSLLAPPVREPRMSNPDFFYGSRSETKAYLTQVRMVMAANPSCYPSEKSKILYAASYLRGPAFAWAQPYLQGDHTAGFNTFESFANSLLSHFGEKDEILTAERDIYLLKQTSSVSLYATEFTKLSGFLKWNDAALCSQFYRNLKPKIKDELSTLDKPNELKKMIELSIKIDNRMYERHLERKMEFPQSDTYSHATSGNNYSHPSNRANNNGPIHDNRIVPMEIDSMSVKTYRGKLTPEELDRRRRSNLCIYCGDSSHLIETCPIKPKNSHSNLKGSARRI